MSDNKQEDPNRLDTEKLAPYLEVNIDGFEGFLQAEKFDSGQSNPTYMIEAKSGRYVLRAKPPGELLKSAHQVDREYKVMKALEGSTVAVPKMFHLADENSPVGRMFFVMEYLDGRIFWDPALSELGEDANAERAAIYDSMNQTLANLHEVDLEAVGLLEFGRPGSYFERQLSRWTKQYLASEISRNEDIHNLIAWLEKQLPADDGLSTLVHGDYRLDNMIFAHDSAEILALLDWELSTIGHPYADLAYQCMQWRLPHEGGFRGLGGVNRKAAGLPIEEDYVAAYCKRRNLEGIDNWFFYVAFSFFRLIAILQGVYRRSVDGNASNPKKAQRYGMAVPIMAQMVMQMIAKEG